VKPHAAPEDSLPLDDDPLWYKDAIFYELHVKAFQDSNGDGIGDFRGLIQRLDYLQDLGVTVLWILPFFPSPLRDDGYDIADYTSVHPAYGTLEDFRDLLEVAHRRGLRIITELVMNHTSDQHPWFQRARRAPAGSPERDWYVWSDNPEKFSEARIIFKDFEQSNWSWDPLARAYYWHRFYTHQPDLNFDNPEVQSAMLDVVDFWLQMGVDGLRLDAVPYLYEREGTSCENLPETHAFLKRLRKHVDEKFHGRMLLAEANQWPEDAAAYFGNDDEVHMAFHFPLMPRLYMALQSEDRFDIIDVLAQTPPIPPGCQWASFLRNHDELTLEMVTEEERDEMYRAFAQDPQARINLGIRRRLAPLLENHRGKLELLKGLLLSLPGTPVLYYGDEIGMGDNIYLGDRNGVRTPMQWSPDRNAGFSHANPQQLYSPVVIDPEYHYEYVNAEVQQRNPHSLLWWVKHRLALRKRFKAFGRGTIEFLLPENPKVLAYLRRYEDECLLVVANLSRFAQFAELDLSAFEGMVPVEAAGQVPFPAITSAPYRLTLTPYALHWFALQPSADAHLRKRQEPSTIPTLRVPRVWENVFEGWPARGLAEALTRYLSCCAWLGRHPPVRSAAISERVVLDATGGTIHLCLVEVEWAEGEPWTCVVPLRFTPEDRAGEVLTHRPQTVVARLDVRGERAVSGILHDAMSDPILRECWLAALAANQHFKGPGGEVAAVAEAEAPPAVAAFSSTTGGWGSASVLRDEAHDTLISLGERLVLKALRHVEAGRHSEVEVLRALQSRTSFRDVPRLAGTVEYRPTRGQPTTLALLLELPEMGQSAWAVAVDTLGRYCEHVLARHDSRPEVRRPPLSWRERLDSALPVLAQESIGPELPTFTLLGQRVAQLHGALASLTFDHAFWPESFSMGDQRSLYQAARSDCRRACERLRSHLGNLPESLVSLARKVLTEEPALLARLRSILEGRLVAMRQRVHGHLDLALIAWTGKDFVIAAPGGDPDWPLTERRRKRSPLYDVATLLRSFNRAAMTAAREGNIRSVDLPTLEPWLETWLEGASLAFVQGYLETAKEYGFLPDRDTSARLLDFFLLERAITELHDAIGQSESRLEAMLEAMLRMVERQE
jgi:maltose alpha-D-glucosyltransferase/alpha-amylase